MEQNKKRLESYICNSLKDRVDFFYSNYKIHDGIGRTYITVDENEVYNMCTLKRGYYREPKEGIYFILKSSKMSKKHLALLI